MLDEHKDYGKKCPSVKFLVNFNEIINLTLRRKVIKEK